MPTKTFLCSLFLLLNFALQAQTPRIDSLKKAINSQPASPEQLTTIYRLLLDNASLSNDTLAYYAGKGYRLAKQLKDEPRASLMRYYTGYSMARSGIIDGRLDSLIKNEMKTVAYKGDYKEAYARFIMLDANRLTRSNKIKEAMQLYYGLLPLLEKDRDTTMLLNLQLNMSTGPAMMGHFTESLAIIHPALAMARTYNEGHYSVMDLQAEGLLNSNAAICFLHLYEADHRQLYADSCLYYTTRSIEIGEKVQSLYVRCASMNVKGLMLSYLNRVEEAEHLLQSGLQLRKQIGDPLYTVSDMTVLASFYSATGKPQQGVLLCMEALQLARERNLSAAIVLVYNTLAECYRKAGDNEKYAQTLQQLVSFKDTLYRENSARALAELQTQYEVQKKENTIIQQQLDLTRKNQQLYGVAGILIAAALIGIILFISYRKRQQLRLRMIQEEEKILSAQAVKEAEEHERKRIAADLHDNLGAYAASMVSNVNQLQMMAPVVAAERSVQELRNNSLSIVSELTDTIWVLKREALTLTAISDRIKVFVQRIQPSYPHIHAGVVDELENDHSLPPSQAFHLYRILQEAINNAFRHSGADEVLILFQGGESWEVMVKDNGRGLPADVTKHGGGNGLYNMRTRAQEVGWKIGWRANEGGGTVMMISAE
ncbi:sensor histidine kinase [Nostoc ellipsosporum NOK]|nr:sensor histidine kinase [Nostoc ellipsosporum NOK]